MHKIATVILLLKKNPCCLELNVKVNKTILNKYPKTPGSYNMQGVSIVREIRETKKLKCGTFSICMCL